MAAFSHIVWLCTINTIKEVHSKLEITDLTQKSNLKICIGFGKVEEKEVSKLFFSFHQEVPCH